MKFLPVFLAGFFLINGCKRTREYSEEEARPNIVFILIDDLGWADVSCNFPGSFYDTPNIDKLAKKGVRFTRAYSAHPVCSPTRAAIMTGKHPNRTGITDWIPGLAPKDRPLLGPSINNELALEELSLAEKLKDKGYKTCFIGKWHLGNEGFYPEDQGFDINIGGHHSGSPPGGYYSPYKNPKLEDGPEGEYLTDRLTEEGIRFMKASKEDPFLLFLAYYTVHAPIQACDRYVDKYNKKKAEPVCDADSFAQEGDGWTRLIQNNADYASMVAAMDENVGKLLKAINDNQLDENTWVIFTSDNGGLSTHQKKTSPTSNFPLRAGKGWCYEGGIRVPLIIAGPGVNHPGMTSDEPVISMDFFPTIMSIAGIKSEKNDGENLLPVLEGESLCRDELFWHFPHYHGSRAKPASALLKGNWKLLYFYEDNHSELYNLLEDPGEIKNLAEVMPEKTAELKKILDARLYETGARFPMRNEGYSGGT